MEAVQHDTGFKWGLIGPGQIARDFVCDMALVRDYPSRVTAVVGKGLEDARTFSEAHGIPAYYGDLNRMIEQARPDVVYVATPHTTHSTYTLACLERGIPVLCEKPLGVTEAEVRQMVELSERRGVFLLEGMWIRYLPSISRLKALLRQGVVGRIRAVTADMSFRAPHEEGSRFYNPELGGGSLLDLGIYPVYLALLLLGEPETIQARALLTTGRVDEDCAVILGYQARHAYALAESSLVRETGREAVVWGETGRLTIRSPWNEKSPALSLSFYGGETVHYPLAWEGRGLQFEITEVLRCVTEGRRESESHPHGMSIRLAGVLDEVRRQAGVVYPWEEAGSGR